MLGNVSHKSIAKIEKETIKNTLNENNSPFLIEFYWCTRLFFVKFSVGNKMMKGENWTHMQVFVLFSFTFTQMPLCHFPIDGTGSNFRTSTDRYCCWKLICATLKRVCSIDIIRFSVSVGQMTQWRNGLIHIFTTD